MFNSSTDMINKWVNSNTLLGSHDIDFHVECTIDCTPCTFILTVFSFMVQR